MSSSPARGSTRAYRGSDEALAVRAPQVLAGQPLPLAVAFEEAAHLGLVGARPRVAGGEEADELEVAEVARRHDVHPPLAVQAEHLDGPGADLADREQAADVVVAEV